MLRKKVLANIPTDLLRQACKISALNQTQALVAGLNELIGARRREALLKLKGKIRLELDPDKIRQRVRL